MLNHNLRRWWPALLLLTLACSVLAPVATLPPPPATPTSAPAPTLAPTPTQTPTQTQTQTQTAFHLQPNDITFHPDPQLYAGDWVSLEVSAANADPAWQDADVRLYAQTQTTEPLGSTKFGRFGIGGRAQATFFWAWNTAGLQGPQTLILTVGPAVAPLDVLTFTANLLPADQRPMPEPLAAWTESQSACCVFHYLSNTAAARDIASIQSQADAAFAQVEETLGVQRSAKVSFTLLSRLLGHGGFASDEISLTYIDRDAAASDLYTVFVHEGTHILDRNLSPQGRTSFFTEGLAVFVAGGHFKPEDLPTRAAATLVLDRYIPLETLINNFYPAQHEIGYLEGGAFVHYLVTRFGWEAFLAVYADLQEAPSEAARVDGALQRHVGHSLSELEADWLAMLRALPPDFAQAEDLRLTVALYDTLRRYQQLNDPSAYFLTAWLPNGPGARERNITADFVRHPRSPENVALEVMLAGAGRALVEEKFDGAEQLIASVNAVLDTRNLFFDPLAAQYLQIVTRLDSEGYEAQHITLTGETATVTAIAEWPTLMTLTLTHSLTGWR